MLARRSAEFHLVNAEPDGDVAGWAGLGEAGADTAELARNSLQPAGKSRRRRKCDRLPLGVEALGAQAAVANLACRLFRPVELRA